MARVSLVACDLDGTMLDPSGSVPEETARLLATLDERGVRTVPVTARMPRTVLAVARAIPFVPAIVCANGAIVFDPGQRRVISRLELSSDQVRQLVRTVRSVAPDARLALESSRGYVREHGFARKRAVPGEHVVDDVLGADAGAAVKLSVQDHGVELGELAHTLSAAIEQCAVTNSGAAWIDISHPQASKGLAITRWSGTHGIESDEVLAIGDALNDLDLLRWAGLAAAVDNAHSDLAAVADVELPGAHRGVTKLLGVLLQAQPASL